MKSNISQARINQQIRNMLKEPLHYLKAAPLQNDLYTWHFTIQGPQNSDFHEGLYHGQILLPFEYPFKPPDIVFMNKNGRFQTNTKICLTITQYHPQEWNSAWTIRTMLQAVISLFNENIQGIGYQQGSTQQRKLLAKRSHDFRCEKCGTLKDLLKPREPPKQEVKKQEQKNDQNFASPEIQKLEYASEITFRKVNTQDIMLNSYKKQDHKHLNKSDNQLSSQKHINENKNKSQYQNQSKKGDTTVNEKQQTPNITFYNPQNNSIGLDRKSKIFLKSQFKKIMFLGQKFLNLKNGQPLKNE